MERTITNKLIAWKNNPKRKPLIVYGARQIGKTYTNIETLSIVILKATSNYPLYSKCL